MALCRLPKVRVMTKEIRRRCKSSVRCLGVLDLVEDLDQILAELIFEEAFSKFMELLVARSGIRRRVRRGSDQGGDVGAVLDGSNLLGGNSFGSSFGSGLYIQGRQRLVIRHAPSDGNTAALIIRRLTSMRRGKIINGKNVTLLPAAENHVLVNGSSDFVHFLERDGSAVPKSRVQSHLVPKKDVLDVGEDGNENTVNEEANVVETTESEPQFSRESGPMKDVGVVEPDHFMGNRMPLEGLVDPFLEERVLVGTNPLHLGGLLLEADLLDFVKVFRSEQLRPAQHGSDVVRPLLPDHQVLPGVLDFLCGKLFPELR